jgi:hypothetical protein
MVFLIRRDWICAVRVPPAAEVLLWSLRIGELYPESGRSGNGKYRRLKSRIKAVNASKASWDGIGNLNELKKRLDEDF